MVEFLRDLSLLSLAWRQRTEINFQFLCTFQVLINISALNWSILLKFWWNDNYIKFAKQWWKPHLFICYGLSMGAESRMLLKWRNQQRPPLCIYVKVGVFWLNLKFDFFAHSFPAIYRVYGNTIESFIRWPLRTALTDCFQTVECHFVF